MSKRRRNSHLNRYSYSYSYDTDLATPGIPVPSCRNLRLQLRQLVQRLWVLLQRWAAVGSEQDMVGTYNYVYELLHQPLRHAIAADNSPHQRSGNDTVPMDVVVERATACATPHRAPARARM